MSECSLYKVMSMFTSLPTFPVFIGYIALVYSYPQWRKSLPVLQLRTALIVHNTICVLISIVSTAAFAWYLLFVADSIYGRRFDPTVQSIFAIYSYCKIFELMDTVFMMLRNKSRQISWLHVYHHATMVLLADCGYRIFPWPSMALPILLNSFVHIWVYGYYLLSAIDKSYCSMRLKRSVTEVQLAQFFIGLYFTLVGYQRAAYCVYAIFYDLSMIVLFGNFYYFAYLRKRTPKTTGDVKKVL